MPPIKNVPHPFPYQGSKRQQASQIVSLIPKRSRLFELFLGSGAVSVAALATGRVPVAILNDSHVPLISLWKSIIYRPHKLADDYEQLWHEQQGDPKSYFNQTRARFNATGEPACLLYLLARCVKAAIRYNSNGEFNNSPDHRRLGMRPSRMRENIVDTSRVLKGRVEVHSTDYREMVSGISSGDTVYLDPPYQGVCKERDSRYHQGISFDDFVEFLDEVQSVGAHCIVSYDGRTGDRQYGQQLPDSLDLSRVEIRVGRSAQETLLGRDSTTFESLYVSRQLAGNLKALAMSDESLFAAIK